MRPVALRSTTTSRDVVRSCEPGHRDATTILGIVIRRATHKQQDAECKSRGDEKKNSRRRPTNKGEHEPFFLSYQAHLICFIGFNARYFLFFGNGNKVLLYLMHTQEKSGLVSLTCTSLLSTTS